jgi:OFA family oxalate/formate antiporter-like MFS transporter
MSPIFNRLLTGWGYEKMNLIIGSAALVFGLLASALIRVPEMERSQSASDTVNEKIGSSVAEALKSREFWYIWFTWVFAGAAGASMLVLATGFGLARGLNLSQSIVLLTCFNLTNGGGRLVSGFFSDWLGRSRTMAICFAGAAAAYLIMPHFNGIMLWAALAAVVGLAFGTLFAVTAPLTGDCFGMTHFGAIFGLIFTAYGFLSGPLGPWLSGYILDLTRGNYTMVFSYLGLMYLVSAGLILLVQPERQARQSDQK